MKSIIKFKDFLNEELQKIYFKNKELKWNPNKTEMEFKERIKERTSLSEKQFIEVIQKGIKLKENYIPEDNSICLYFFLSKFILLLNTKEMVITTIRDARWDKPSGRCKSIRIVNEDVLKMPQYELDYYSNQEYFEFGINENFDMILESKCNYCFKIDL